jgi:hypothetical protein
MFECISFRSLFIVAVLCAFPAMSVTPSLAVDIRGMWVGNAKGTIFGAEGSVTITHQNGEEIQGIVEGGNFFGKAKFTISGRVRDGYIFGSKDGHTFNGYLYPDGIIRGLFRSSDGDNFQVVLQRANPYWGWGLPPQSWQGN